ncbi:hypothetical protein C4D60_Mb06t19930 [Musa balbisiana]|uniref:Uncharacterized protein n=1 Tax=Musa balbisiana TaxID=52838 RepID=A0A4S8IPH0_MUSBA|nr:hypothetical protein C4D60_Mb06t19930 [Musa balbisiana]
MARFGGWIRFLMSILRVLMERPVPSELELVNGEMVRFCGRIRFLLSFLRFLMERPVRSKVQLLF